MSRSSALAAVLAVLVLAPQPVSGSEERVDLDMLTRIRAEGLERPQVMDTLFWLADVIGPRLTGSPEARKASEWARDQLARWGLSNVHVEPFPFGRGWAFTRASARLVAPREAPLFALPEAWTPGTEGPVRGPVVQVKILTEKDFAQYHGKLAGKIVLLQEPRMLKLFTAGQAERLDEAGLAGLVQLQPPTPSQLQAQRTDERLAVRKRAQLRRALGQFLGEEKALALISASGEEDILRVKSSGIWEQVDEEAARQGANGVPGLILTNEGYDGLVRLLDHGQPIELEIDIASRYDNKGVQAVNTVAEIPGSDGRGEVVMAGAHLDSWHMGTGATDNATGCAVVTEALRILKAVGAKPRRTIRVVLWMGEEEGHLGSYYYVKEHFATRPEPVDPVQKALPEPLRDETWPLQLKPEYGKLAAYFNVDNGSGRIRGIYAEGNAAVRPIFEAWFEPLRDLGASAVTLRAKGESDHVSFDSVGLPGFQFIQDELDYRTRTHHTNLDVYDRARAGDLQLAAVVLASFLYNAAMRPDLLPRKPLPTASGTGPFPY